MTNRLIHLVFFFFAFSFAANAQGTYENGFLVNIGETAPDFSAELTDGTIFRLSENRGKIVMLQFTASWCGVCRREMPFIEKDIWGKLKGEKFVLIGVDRDEPLDVALKFQEQMNITYPLALDNDADVFGLYADLLAGVTRNVIINENGEIIFLSRLFDQEEFKEMTEVIFEAVDNL